jgi:nitrite reductase/ring-hydroxylating ferredoxin subunit
LIFNARRRFNLHTTPTFYTIVQISPDEFQRQIDHFAAAIKKPEPDPADFEYEGLAPEAYKVLYEQGVRGGPILALERLVQAQAKSIRILLLIADERPIEMYHFDLVGASPHSSAENLDEFYEDIVLRITTTMSTIDVNQHQVVVGTSGDDFVASVNKCLGHHFGIQSTCVLCDGVCNIAGCQVHQQKIQYQDCKQQSKA